MGNELTEQRLSQMAAFYLASMCLIGTLFRPLVAEQDIIFSFFGVGNFLLAASIYFLIRNNILVKYAGIFTVAVTYLCLLPLLTISGGINSQFIVLLILIPTLTSFLCNARVLLLATITLIAVVLALNNFNYLINDLDGEVVSQNKQNAKTFWLIVSILSGASFGYYYRILNHKLKVALNTAAYIDVLTKIANRRQIEQNLHQEIAIANREHKPLGVMLLDVDFFKQLNDEHGHDVGDACLQQLAQHLKHDIRQSDYVGRYGGEEFLLVFPNTNKSELTMIGTKLVNSIANINIYHNDNAYKLTVTIGGCSHVSENDLSAREVLKQADNALYQGKHLGRNKFILSDENLANKTEQ